MDTDNCQWCKNNLTEHEQILYEFSEGNCVYWCGLDKFRTCDKCMETMCEICKGPCHNICNKCKMVCHSYLCDDMTTKCNHRCACNNPPKDGLEALNLVPFEITPNNLNNYTKNRLQDENVKYGLARCENETKDKTINKLSNHFKKLYTNKTCVLKLDEDTEIEYTYPHGKTRLDLNKVLNDFFSS